MGCRSCFGSFISWTFSQSSKHDRDMESNRNEKNLCIYRIGRNHLHVDGDVVWRYCRMKRKIQDIRGDKK